MRMLRMDRQDLADAVPAPVPAGYALRTFAPADWEACLALMLASPDPAYVGGPWDRELCERSMSFAADENLDFPDGRGQLLFAGDTLVAMALCSATGYLNQVYTLPGHRRRGLAAAAVTRVLAALHAQGIARCFLLVFQGNEVARLAYERLGFVVTGPPERA